MEAGRAGATLPLAAAALRVEVVMPRDTRNDLAAFGDAKAFSI